MHWLPFISLLRSTSFPPFPYANLSSLSYPSLPLFSSLFPLPTSLSSRRYTQSLLSPHTVAHLPPSDVLGASAQSAS